MEKRINFARIREIALSSLYEVFQYPSYLVMLSIFTLLTALLISLSTELFTANSFTNLFVVLLVAILNYFFYSYLYAMISTFWLTGKQNVSESFKDLWPKITSIMIFFLKVVAICGLFVLISLPIISSCSILGTISSNTFWRIVISTFHGIFLILFSGAFIIGSILLSFTLFLAIPILLDKKSTMWNTLKESLRLLWPHIFSLFFLMLLGCIIFYISSLLLIIILFGCSLLFSPLFSSLFLLLASSTISAIPVVFYGIFSTKLYIALREEEKNKSDDITKPLFDKSSTNSSNLS